MHDQHSYSPLSVVTMLIGGARRPLAGAKPVVLLTFFPHNLLLFLDGRDNDVSVCASARLNEARELVRHRAVRTLL